MSTNMLAISVGQGLVATLFVVICALLILVVLLQKGRGGGLSGAFGGVGGHSAFGAKTGDVFTWITVALTGLFILMAVVGNWTFVPRSAKPTPVVTTPQAPAQGPRTTPGQTPSGRPAGTAGTSQPS